MAQIATTRTGQATAEAPKAATHPRAADVARDLTNKAQGTMLRLIDKAAAASAGDNVGTTSPLAATKPSVVLPLQAVAAAVAFEMLQAGGAVAGFWIQQGNDQLAHHDRTVKKLAAARYWRERLEIQSAFLHDSLARLNQGVARYVDATGALAVAASNKGQQR